MANTITVTPNVKLSAGNVADTLAPGAQVITQNLVALWKDVVSLTAGADTSISALIDNITTLGICYMWNLDPTNYVQVGPDNGAGAIVPYHRLNPNDIPHTIRLEPGITIRAKAHTGNCKVLIAVYND